jgi:hypothetical protein
MEQQRSDAEPYSQIWVLCNSGKSGEFYCTFLKLYSTYKSTNKNSLKQWKDNLRTSNSLNSGRYKIRLLTESKCMVNLLDTLENTPTISFYTFRQHKHLLHF